MTRRDRASRPIWSGLVGAGGGADRGGRRSCSSWRHRPRRPTPSAVNGVGLHLRGAGHAAVGRPTPRPRASGQLHAHRLARWPHRVRTRTSSTSPAPRPSSPRCSVGNINPARGYQYVPDVAGAVAIMYHVQDAAGDAVDYLHLSPRDDRPDLHGRHLQLERPGHHRRQQGPQAPRTSRSRSSTEAASRAPPACSTTSCQHTDPALFARVGGQEPDPDQRPHHPARHAPRASPARPWPSTARTQIAEHIASGRACGASATTSSATPRPTTCPPRGCRTQSGKYQLPVRPEHLGRPRGGQAAARPQPGPDRASTPARTRSTYPISAYSYIVTQCASAADRPTCKGDYSNPGITETLARSGCATSPATARCSMASIGYSPLPPNLSQEIANSIARMKGNGRQTRAPDRGQLRQPPLQGTARCRRGRALGSAQRGEEPRRLGVLFQRRFGRPAVAASSGSSGSRLERRAERRPLAQRPRPGWRGPSWRPAGAAACGATPSPILYDRPLGSVPVLLPILFILALVAVPPLLLGRKRRRVT